MESLLASDAQNKRNGDLRESLCYYLSIIVVLLTFIFSCVSLGICSASTIQSKLYTYKFPFFNRFITYTPGTPVHIDREGNVFPGAGTTIYLNVTNEVRQKEMVNVKLRELNHFMTLAVYNGGVTAFRGSWDAHEHVVKEEQLPATKDGDPRRVSDVIKLSHNRFIIIGSHEVLPMTVNVNFDESTRKINVDFVFGKPQYLIDDDDRWPHVDRLNNETFAMTYEKGEDVWYRLGFWKGEGSSAIMELTDAERLYTRFSFHGVAGLDDNHFVVAVTGSYNQTGGTRPIVAANLATIGPDRKVTLGKWQVLPFTISHNFFDIDNIDNNNAVMVFADSENAGISAVIIHYERDTNEIFFGAQRHIQNGGAVLDYNRIDIRVLSPTTFAVFYEDNAIKQLVLVLCALTNSRDIYVISPKYIISPFRRGDFRGDKRTWYDICESGWGDFNMIEYSEVDFMGRKEHLALVHKGVIQTRLFGIAQKSHKNHVEVQFAGFFNVPKKYTLQPGRAVYTNSKGELMQGAPYGYANRDFGHFYEYNRERQEIYANFNLVGMAVTKKKVFMKFH